MNTAAVTTGTANTLEICLADRRMRMATPESQQMDGLSLPDNPRSTARTITIPLGTWLQSPRRKTTVERVSEASRA